MEQSVIDRYWRHLLAGLAIGILVVFVLAVIADGRRLASSLARFEWTLVPLILALTVFNYALRFIKWQLFLRWIGVHQLSHAVSLGIFLAGFAMTITPGKVGEFLKSYLLRRATGTPVATTAPVVLAERLTDGLAMAILALLSAFAGIQAGWAGLALVLLLLLGGISLIQQRRMMLAFLRWCTRLPLVRRQAGAVYELYNSSYELFRPRRLAVVTVLSVVSWFGECLALWVILHGLGLPPTRELLALSIFSLSTASIAGALSLLPGGLGAAEASITGILLLFSQPRLSPATAAAATLLIRFATLWFGVGLGLIGLLWVQQRLERLGAVERAAGPSPPVTRQPATGQHEGRRER
ncbi:flippase-like domain-containing protein [Thermomicrobiaceae bacterium CFH 74404]|uniref:Flippase-like domain-containing protein n=1 Tax=Thermalbibacter longus TaxID=2951981 RepID=A0AA41WDT1_9BACT|nr:lysylphosphatidylglycerol synthase transmembrane domain-containing protein [Thermalbibacter longus]MCM8748228.1 flippase-like domain-containing protein [Thermalbibacter longus]